MVYFSGLLLLTVLVLLGLHRWLRVRRPSPKTVDACLKKAEQAVAVGDWEEAHAAIQDLLKRDELNARCACVYAQILTGLRQFDRALLVIERAVNADPSEPRLQRERGRLCLKLGRAEDALESFGQCSSLMQDEAGRIDIASALYQVGEVEAAWEQLRELVLESSNGRLLALAGDCHFQLRNFPLAVTFYQQAQHYGWMNQRTVARTGHSLQQSGQFSEAERHFRQLLEADSSDVLATLGLGTCYEAQGLYRRALIIYQSGRAWDIADPRILRQAGICAVHTRQYSYAELYLSEAIERGQSSPKVLAYLGYALEAQRRWKEAEAVYLRLLEEFSEHPAGYRALAWLYGVGLSQSLSHAEGISVAQRALELLPDACSWELLSACEARGGNFVRAHHIQEQLSEQTHDIHTRRRRRQAMRILRKGRPLNEEHVSRTLVA